MLDKFNIILRNVTESDIDNCIELFRNTIHTVNAKDYLQTQLDLWAPKVIDKKVWWESISQHIAYVAMIDNQIVGFGDMSYDGKLDRLYIHKDYQGKKIASTIAKRLEGDAQKLGINKITTEASITAKPFFESLGYKVIKQQTVELSGEKLINFIMSKAI